MENQARPIIEGMEICYIETSGPRSYVEEANQKLEEGWAFFGDNNINRNDSWSTQYFIKQSPEQKSKGKTVVKD